MGRKFFFGFILLLLFSYFFVTPRMLNEVEANHCTAPRPGSAPILTSAVPADKSVTLTWIEAQDPVTYYLLAYGTSPTAIEYGAPNIGGEGITSFTVGELKNGVKYYFRVRAVNGCKPGKFSNKLSAIPGSLSGTVLGTKKTLSKAPNLSIYKQVLGASVSATPTLATETEAPVQEVTAIKETKCLTCIGWQLLVGELIFLMLFFYFAKRHIFLKQIYSLAIPFAIYILFARINSQCLTDDFWCKYFLQLDILIFILIVVMSKHKNILKS